MSAAAQAEKKPKLWRYEPSDGQFHCTHPGCEYAHDDPGGINLHFTKKHRTPQQAKPNAAATRTAAKSERPAQEPKQSNRHVHTWRLLRGDSPLEAEARKRGYREVCMECEDLR